MFTSLAIKFVQESSMKIKNMEEKGTKGEHWGIPGRASLKQDGCTYQTTCRPTQLEKNLTTTIMQTGTG